MAGLAVGICATRMANADPESPSDSPACERDSGLAWSHANAWDYSLTGIGAAALVVELGIFQPIRPPLHWSKPIAPMPMVVDHGAGLGVMGLY